MTVLSPNNATIGGPDLPVNIYGMNFSSDAVAVMDGTTDMPSTVPDSGTVTFTCSPATETVRSAQFSVRNGDGQVSNSQSFSFHT